jgi:hypothetical protein
MADANANTGARHRFETAGKVRIVTGGATDYIVLAIEAGSLEWSRGGAEGVSEMERGSLSGSVISGDQRPGSLGFTFSPTKNGYTAAAGADLFSIFDPALTGGLKTLVDIEVEILDGIGLSTGTKLTFSDCWLSEPLAYSAGGRGASYDTIRAVFQVEDAASPARTALT